MSALLKEETFTLTSPEAVETVEAAIGELTRLFVEADARRNRIGRRLREVQSGAVEVRRRHARTELDAFLPPLRLLALEDVAAENAPPVTLRGVLTVLRDSLDDVWRIWWGKHFMPWWRAR
jgi:hypothetical protein